MAPLMLILIAHRLVTVHNWVVSNETYEDNEVLRLFDDNTYDDDNPNDYTGEKPPTNIEEQSRLLDFEENYVKPNIKHNSDLHKLYDRRRKKKRDLPDSDDVTIRYKTANATEETYDYDKFKAEYDQEVEELKKFQAKLNDSDFLLQPMSDCDYEFLLNVGPLTMVCLVRELCYGPTMKIRREAKAYLVRLARIWLVFFVIVFLIGWCHCGYCNWLCPSKYCFPEDGYEEIKQGLVLNPPGSRTDKIIPKKDDNSKTVIQKQYYEPTETEYYLHNSLWKDIYHD